MFLQVNLRREKELEILNSKQILAFQKIKDREKLNMIHLIPCQDNHHFYLNFTTSLSNNSKVVRKQTVILQDLLNHSLNITDKLTEVLLYIREIMNE